MTHQTPIDTKNLDQYGNDPLPWSFPFDILTDSAALAGTSYFLSSVRPDGRPHTQAVGAMWIDDAIYIVSGPGTRKSKNLAANPACTIAVGLKGIDLVLEGTVDRVTDSANLERIVASYRNVGWPAEVEGDAFTAPYTAPSGGPPPWWVYRFTFHTAFGVGGAEPGGATRWRFEH